MNRKKAKEEIIYSTHQALISLRNIEMAYKLEGSASLKSTENALFRVLKYTKSL